MASHNVVIKKRYAAYNVDAYNRTAIFEADVDNGCVAALKSYSENEGEGIVWKAEQATATDKGLWMATSPEVVISRVFDGDPDNGVAALDYKGIVNDPRAFYNIAGYAVDMIKMVPGDVYEMTGAGIDGIADATYLVPDTADYKLKAASAAGDGCALRKIGTSYLHIGNGALVKTPVQTYKFEVEAN
jgi:hypothetical protein